VLTTMGICIDRCLCFNQSFAELHKRAQEQGITALADLQKQVVFGQKCKLCHPYVQTMLRTGETVFDRILTEKDLP